MTSIDFTSLASEAVIEQLEAESQYQLIISDGCYVIWQEHHFLDISLTPAKEGEAQAVLQFFAKYGCPYSLHRLGCSLSLRSSEHGPIISEGLAIHCLLKGFETISSWKYDPVIRPALNTYVATEEYLLARQLLLTYWDDIDSKNLCPEIVNSILSVTPLSKRYQ